MSLFLSTNSPKVFLDSFLSCSQSKCHLNSSTYHWHLYIVKMTLLRWQIAMWHLRCSAEDPAFDTLFYECEVIASNKAQYFSSMYRHTFSLRKSTSVCKHLNKSNLSQLWWPCSSMLLGLRWYDHCLGNFFRFILISLITPSSRY